MPFEVALRMRDFSGLQGRIARGEQISNGEMQAKYFPLAADHERVRQWLLGQGLAVTRTDDNHLAIFGRGSVDAVARAFQVAFARVAKGGAEYTSAVSAPSLPADIAPVVLGIHGLQPHIRAHILSNFRVAAPDVAPSTAFTPSQIAGAYNATGLSQNGAGQTIALYEWAFPKTTDLSTFWTNAGVSQSANNVQTVEVAGGPGSSPASDNVEEATLDAEWSGALAPGATLRIYAADENDPAENDEILQQVYADIQDNVVTGLHQMAICIGSSELDVDFDYLVIEAQYMASLASAGVSVLSASGDTGAYIQGAADEGEPNASVLQVTTPTSDPSVTGVGGTTLNLSATGTVSTETGWSGSGGGTSAFYSRPAWQAGSGVPAGSMRLVPDVASVADPNTPALIVFNGNSTSVGGTSWAAPTWAAWCALLNQNRSKPLGLLNPILYPLSGSSAIRDITTGTNGYYSAGQGYDMATGIGVPNVTNLLAATAALSASLGPIVTSQLGSQVVTPGQSATFFVTAYGVPAPSYQWQRMPSGSASFSNLTDGGAYSGSATSMLVVSGATSAMSGDEFQCVVTNSSGSATSTPAAGLTVNPTGATTLAGWPASGGSVNGTGWAARFDEPGSVRVDASDNVYVADSYNNTIRKVASGAVVTTVAGIAGQSGSTDGSTGTALFNGPAGVAFNQSATPVGALFVADDGNHVIREINLASGQVTTFAGSGTAGQVNGTGTAAEFSDPQNLAFDSSGNIYVADGDGNTIRKVTPAGVVSTLAGSGTAGSANGPGGVAQFNYPTGVTVDSSGNVYVADYGNNTVRMISPAGVVTTLAGSPGISGSADGVGSGALFNGPTGVTADAYGNLYVTDSGNDTIREVSPTGAVFTVAGSPGVQEDIDGLPENARFADSGDITIDPSGVLFVADTINDTIRRLVPNPPPTPSIAAPPESQSVVAGSSVTLSAAVDATAPLTYQWNLNGAPISGATGATYTISDVQQSNAGSYSVTVTNPEGTVTSSAATLTITLALPVTFTEQPSSQTMANGSTVVFSAAASGAPAPAYQWSFDGNPLSDGALGSATISGAAGPTLVITGVTAANAGTYICTATNLAGPTQSSPATLTVSGTTDVGRLVNISCRADVGTGADILIAGFVIGGAGTSGKESLLVRASGPALIPYGVAGTLPDPQLQLFSGSTPLATNDGWAGNATIASTAAAVGAFAWTNPSSHDAALLETLSSGAYTAQVAGQSGDTGVALAEVYDATPAGTYTLATPRLINISARVQVGTGGNILIAGFVVGGTTSETVLIRASGPALIAFGVTGTLPDPKLQLYSGSALLQTNTGWGGNAEISNAASSVGAFAWTNLSSNDSALLITLSPGAYTAQVSGVSGDTGVALVEVYELQ